MIKMTAHCGGCDATTPAGQVRQVFRSFSGRSYGLGNYHEAIEWDLPDGWVKFDLIGCTYCPSCAAEIWPEAEAAS